MKSITDPLPADTCRITAFPAKDVQATLAHLTEKGIPFLHDDRGIFLHDRVKDGRKPEWLDGLAPLLAPGSAYVFLTGDTGYAINAKGETASFRPHQLATLAPSLTKVGFGEFILV